MQRFRLEIFPLFLFCLLAGNHKSFNPTEAGRFTLDRFLLDGSPKPKQQCPAVTSEVSKSLYMALFSCVKDAIAICFSFLFCWTGIFQNKKKKGLKWPMNDLIRRRRHTGTHDQGSEVRVLRVWSPTEDEKSLFPV